MTLCLAPGAEVPTAWQCNSGPRLIGFAESNRVGMARAAISPEGLIGHLCDVRAAHDDLHAGGAHCICHAIGLGNHPGHPANADQSDILFTDIALDAFFIMGCALPSINNTSWLGGVNACRRNIQRCGMKLRVTPLSGLYSRIFIAADELIISRHSVQRENQARGAMHRCALG